MAVPKYYEFTLPLIKLLKKHGELSNGEIRELMIYEIDINPEDLEEKLPAGKNKFIDRIDWAKSVFKEAGLISRHKHEYWTLTQKGIDLASVINKENESLDDLEKTIENTEQNLNRVDNYTD